jgi:hypothetical protein
MMGRKKWSLPSLLSCRHVESGRKGTWRLEVHVEIVLYDNSGHDQTITASGTVGVARCDIGSAYSGART